MSAKLLSPSLSGSSRARSLHVSLLGLAVVISALGCSSAGDSTANAQGECEEGIEGCPCFPNGTCYEGLACNEGSCVVSTQTETPADAGTQQAHDAGGSQTTDAGAQSKDSATEECQDLPVNITQDYTVEPGCWLVKGTPSMPEGAKLTISPGATMKFAKGTGLSIVDGQWLSAQGTKESPVLLTGMESEPGSWNGVQINADTSFGSFGSAIIEYAHVGIAAMTWKDLVGGGISVNNVVLRHNKRYGLVVNERDFRMVSGLVASSNARPVQVGVFSGGYDPTGTPTDSTFKGNVEDCVEVSPLIDTAGIVIDVPFCQ